MIDISNLSTQQLFELHSEIEDKLRKDEIICTANKPTGELAEFLFLKAYPKWKKAANSQAGFDAIGPAPNKLRYQIKGRRLLKPNGSRQLSAIRNLEKGHFDFLAGLFFNRDYSIHRAALIPHRVLLSLFKERKHIAFQIHTNSHVFLLVENIWERPGVKDVTDKLRSVWH